MAKQQEGYIKGEYRPVHWWQKERYRRRIVRTAVAVGVGVVIYSQQKRLNQQVLDLENWRDYAAERLNVLTSEMDEIFPMVWSHDGELNMITNDLDQFLGKAVESKKGK